MSHLSRKFVAILMLLWLPLFSGNALAVSMVMQAMGGGDHGAVAQQGESHMHCPSTAQQHTQHAQLAADQDQSARHQDQQNSAHENCGTCHFACGGYMATASAKVMEAQPLARLFTSPSSQFQSITPCLSGCLPHHAVRPTRQMVYAPAPVVPGAFGA